MSRSDWEAVVIGWRSAQLTRENTAGRQSTTIPPVRLAIAPVIELQRSEATNAANSAISATVGNCLRRVIAA